MLKHSNPWLPCLNLISSLERALFDCKAVNSILNLSLNVVVNLLQFHLQKWDYYSLDYCLYHHIDITNVTAVSQVSSVTSIAACQFECQKVLMDQSISLYCSIFPVDDTNNNQNRLQFCEVHLAVSCYICS